jgi:hypothetical protein
MRSLRHGWRTVDTLLPPHPKSVVQASGADGGHAPASCRTSHAGPVLLYLHSRGITVCSSAVNPINSPSNKDVGSAIKNVEERVP